MDTIYTAKPVLAGKSESKPYFTNHNDLASEQCGGNIVFATDDWFAVAENLLKFEEPLWKEGVYTSCGKWMDGWETRRKRKSGYDWCIIKLGISGDIHGFDIDTSFFTGNYAPKVSIQAATLPNDNDMEWPERISQIGIEANDEDHYKVQEMLSQQQWETVLERSKLNPGYAKTCHNYFEIKSGKRFTHIRLNMFPDGGVARIRVFGQAIPDWSLISPEKVIDLLNMKNGSLCLDYSNVHFGHARNLSKSSRSKCMSDGWETARKLDRPSILELDEKDFLKTEGFEWVVYCLGHVGTITKIEVDTNHFKGNYPECIQIQGSIKSIKSGDLNGNYKEDIWQDILPKSKIYAHKRHFFEKEVLQAHGVKNVRIIIYPDGGISRIRLWGHIDLKI